MVQAGYDYANWEEQYVPEPTRQDKIGPRKTAINKHGKKNVMIKLGIIVFAYALLLVYLCVKSATLGYEIVGLENEIARINTENHRLEYAMAQNTSLDLIEHKAVSELGMIVPGTDMSYTVAAVSEAIEPSTTAETLDNTVAEEKPLQKLYASIMLLAGRNNL